MKLLPNTTFSSVGEVDIEFTYSNVLSESFVGVQEMDIIGIITKVDLTKNRKVLVINSGSIDK